MRSLWVWLCLAIQHLEKRRERASIIGAQRRRLPDWPLDKPTTSRVAHPQIPVVTRSSSLDDVEVLGLFLGMSLSTGVPRQHLVALQQPTVLKDIDSHIELWLKLRRRQERPVQKQGSARASLQLMMPDIVRCPPDSGLSYPTLSCTLIPRCTISR